ncbi:RNA polymerase sigma factor [Clostridium collagenovorans DSM 3089]|uniref:RNA polymerase sigma factor SigI n=1 Tax=Clostridium collagenovorans DSM 3089 TaxID=1121306 RepID=A0A1M5X5U0_9CLOT|nr:sigma factor [Clostridium collagenovorans]SHH95156.1 RNA polymerase sigma factor [Clostridium collagenovorans DSM 3089]
MFSNYSNNPISEKKLNSIIEDYMPLIIKTISSITGKYVSIENDEEFSVGLMAFVEAMEKYEESKGAFPSFAKLVISSRIKTYLIKENKRSRETSMEELMNSGIELSSEYSNPIEDKEELKTEISKFKVELSEFGLSLEDLVQEAPKHEDTRRNAINISEKVSKDEPLTTFIFGKKRLPIKQISLKYTVTEKILKRSKKFILSLVIIFFRNYRNIRLWIKS